jgi:hypothetical protein
MNFHRSRRRELHNGSLGAADPARVHRPILYSQHKCTERGTVCTVHEFDGILEGQHTWRQNNMATGNHLTMV